MVKKLRESFRDKTRDKLYAHLVSLGIDTELVEKGAPEDIGKTSSWPKFFHSDLGSIRITGKEIDVIQITKYAGSGWGDADGGPTYGIDYAIKGHIGGKIERVMAKTKLKKEGISLVSGGLSDISWTGGEIADVLNEDHSLKELMLQEQIPKFGNIEIKPDKKKPLVRICAGRAFPFIYPSEKAFECYNTIAKHIRKLLQ